MYDRRAVVLESELFALEESVELVERLPPDEGQLGSDRESVPSAAEGVGGRRADGLEQQGVVEGLVGHLHERAPEHLPLVVHLHDQHDLLGEVETPVAPEFVVADDTVVIYVDAFVFEVVLQLVLAAGVLRHFGNHLQRRGLFP